MRRPRGTGPREAAPRSPQQDPAQDAELADFARPRLLPPEGAEFRDELRAELWGLLLRLLARLRR